MVELARCTSTWRAALAAAGVAVALAGCGSSANPLHAAVAAARKTLALHGVTYDVSFSRPGLFAPSVRVPGGTAGSDFAGGFNAVRLTLTLAGGSSRDLFVHLYPHAAFVLPSPAPGGVLPAGKAWISVELGNHETGDEAALAAQLEGLAPELPLEEIVWGATLAVKVGTRYVQHVPMAGYRVSIDLARALAGARRAGKSGLAAAIAGELAATKAGRTTVTFWVNGPGYAAELDDAVPGGGMGTATFSFTQLSVKLEGQPPAASQVAPLAAVAPRGRSLWAAVSGP